MSGLPVKAQDLCRVLYDFYRKGGFDLPGDFQQKEDWEMQWMNIWQWLDAQMRYLFEQQFLVDLSLMIHTLLLHAQP